MQKLKALKSFFLKICIQYQQWCVDGALPMSLSYLLENKHLFKWHFSSKDPDSVL
jgi:hypothetical protein